MTFVFFDIFSFNMLISIVGVFVITAALIILLSAFNGIETMIESLYSEFEPDITITAKKRKTFDEREINWREIKKCKGVSSISKGLEEVVVLRHEKKWVNATLIGVESNFLKSIKIKSHLLAGNELFKEKNINYSEIYSKEGNILSKIINLIYLLDYATIYRAIINQNDPSPVIAIDFMKKRV